MEEDTNTYKMRISFDLDGVITDSEKWFYSILNILKLLRAEESLINATEILYYSTRQVRYNPYQFLSPGDSGYIITARKPISIPVTKEWLAGHNIHLLVIYIDGDDTIDWSTNYAKASFISGERKAEIIELNDISVHFDNNPYAVVRMRSLLPKVSIIQVGAEPCQSCL